jgi:hypothetical protein
MARFSRFFFRHTTLSDDGKAECSPLVPDSVRCSPSLLIAFNPDQLCLQPASGSRVLPENAADHQLLMVSDMLSAPECLRLTIPQALHMFDNTPRMKRQPSQESTRSKASCHH